MSRLYDMLSLWPTSEDYVSDASRNDATARAKAGRQRLKDRMG